MKYRFFIVLLALPLIGCTLYESRTYDLSVKNGSSGPITIWLTKDGPPYESGWASPEDLAIESPKMNDEKFAGVIVPEGKTAVTGPRTGQFNSRTRAILRVYGGRLNFNELLASTGEMAGRVDVRLHPGKSDFLVTGNPNMVSVKETGAPQP